MEVRSLRHILAIASALVVLVACTGPVPEAKPSTGDEDSARLDGDGAAWGWADMSKGQLGDGIDRVWDGLSDGGEPGPCGWVSDRFGLWWQVVPDRMTGWMSSCDAEARARVFEAMLAMQELDVEALDPDVRGDGHRGHELSSGA